MKYEDCVDGSREAVVGAIYSENIIKRYVAFYQLVYLLSHHA